MQITPRVKAYLMLLVVSVIWGIASPVIKYTLAGFPATLFLTYRFGISTLVALLIFAISGMHLPRSPKLVGLILIYGFLNSVVSLGFLFFGMENTTVLETGLITLASPLITSTAGVYFLHEHITKRERIGMGIAILGTLITIIGPLVTNGHGELRLTGNLMVFGYVLSTLVTTLLVKKLLKKDVNPMTLTNFSFIIGFICFFLFYIFSGSLPSFASLYQIHYTYHLGVIFMAVVSGTFAFYLSTKAQKSIEIGEASLFSYLLPLFSLPLAVLWLGEKVTPIYIVGGIITIIGVVIAEVKKKRYNSSS